MKRNKLWGFILSFIVNITAMMMTVSAAQTRLISVDVSQWTSVTASFGSTKSDATVAAAGDTLQFSNTNGLWPGMKRTLDHEMDFNVENDHILYDFTPGKQTSIRILFRDAAGAAQLVDINPAVDGARFDPYTGEILASTKAYSGKISLKGLKTGNYNGSAYTGAGVTELMDSHGKIAITGVYIAVIGKASGTVNIRQLAAVTSVISQSTDSTVSGTKLTGTGLVTTTTVANPASSASASATTVTARGGHSLTTNASGVGSSGDFDASLPDSTGKASNTNESVASPSPSATGDVTAVVMNPTSNSSSDRRMFSNGAITLLMLPVGAGILLLAWYLFFRKSTPHKPD